MAITLAELSSSASCSTVGIATSCSMYWSCASTSLSDSAGLRGSPPFSDSDSDSPDGSLYVTCGNIERWWSAQGLACRKERVGDL